jgi:hypothetical protein
MTGKETVVPFHIHASSVHPDDGGAQRMKPYVLTACSQHLPEAAFPPLHRQAHLQRPASLLISDQIFGTDLFTTYSCGTDISRISKPLDMRKQSCRTFSELFKPPPLQRPLPHRDHGSKAYDVAGRRYAVYTGLFSRTHAAGFGGHVASQHTC